MRAAPPVAVRCTAGLIWRGVQTALPALAAFVLAWWGLSWLPGGASATVRPWVSLGFALGIAALAWQRSRTPAQTLAWDGQRWDLDGHAGTLQLMIDLGPALLLRHGGKHWLVASRSQAGAAWHGLRAAVYARGTHGPGGDGLPNV